MEELNLLQHSTYNVEVIAKNKELFNMLFNQIAKTYQLFNVSDRSERNTRRVSFAPTRSRITNVTITIKPNGEFGMYFRGSKDKLETLANVAKYDTSNYRCDADLEIKGITFANYQQHIPTIVKALEYCDYSFV